MGAFEEIKDCLEQRKSFVVEAGAGSGKTYSLIQTLNYLTDQHGGRLEAGRQKIVCITYTNVAKNEIVKRVEFHPLVVVLTIHEFLWLSVKQFQKQLRVVLCQLNELRLADDIFKGKESKYMEGLQSRVDSIETVNYNDSAFRDFEKGELHHDDVIELSKMLFQSFPLLTTIIAQKYPYIFVDEYQDTSKETIEGLVDFLLSRNKGKVVLGFYGDSHQKIYDAGVGDLEQYYIGDKPSLQLIKKEENYRSSRAVVELLNNFRSNIQQVAQRKEKGGAKLIYWERHPEKDKKQKVTEFEESLKPFKNDFYDRTKLKLEENGWSFAEHSKDKILVLANSRIAERAGFLKLYKSFSKRYGRSVKERLLDRNHFLIRIFTGYIDKKTSREREVGLEHLLRYWKIGNHNEAIRFIRRNGMALNEFKHDKKKEISSILNDLLENRETLTIKEVLDLVIDSSLISSRPYEEFLKRMEADTEGLDEQRILSLNKDKLLFDEIMVLSYVEVINLWKHIQEQTVFSTKHGTKGDEYRNVLTVIDDTEWKQEYNFNNFFSNQEETPERKLRTRNLFYVECSRAKEHLLVLVLSKMDTGSLANLRRWFGDENVIDVEKFLSGGSE